jgi:hypothetical protein
MAGTGDTARLPGWVACGMNIHFVVNMIGQTQTQGHPSLYLAPHINKANRTAA